MAVTRDHIPPQCFFPKPRPSNLITVPSCQDCNLGRSDDDEWFRMIVANRDDLRENQDVQSLLKDIFRSWERPEAFKKLKAITTSLIDMPLFTSDGQYLGNHTVIKVDKERMSEYLKQLIRGLFYHETKTRLTEKVRIGISINFEITPSLQEQAGQYLKGKPFQVVGNGLFKYVWNHIEDDPTTGVWLLVFYNKVPFLGITVGQLPNNDKINL